MTKEMFIGITTVLILLLLGFYVGQAFGEVVATVPIQVLELMDDCATKGFVEALGQDFMRRHNCKTSKMRVLSNGEFIIFEFKCEVDI